MRCFVKIVLCCFFILAANASALASYKTLEAWFNSFNASDRFDMQFSLLITGHYHALIDRKFGPETYDALKSYMSKDLATGGAIITDEDLAKLKSASVEKIASYGFEWIVNERLNIALYAPLGWLRSVSADENIERYSSESGDTYLDLVHFQRSQASLKEVYDHLLSGASDMKVTYSYLSPEWFVASGREAGFTFYTKLIGDSEGARGFYIANAPNRKAEAGIFSLILASTLTTATEYKSSPEPELMISPEHTSIRDLATILGPIPAEVEPDRAEPETVATVPDADTATNEVQFSRYGNFIHSTTSPDMLVLNGDITARIALDWRRAINAHPEIKYISLDSYGGYVSSSLVLAHELRRSGIQTWVAKDSVCYSACAFLFFSGYQRAVEGSLGVHQIRAESPDLETAQFTISDILDAMRAFDVPDEVVSAMFRTPSDDMYVFSEAEIVKYGINTMHRGQ